MWQTCFAEYRVFLLKISKQPAATAIPQEPSPPLEDKIFPSTLDPEQYKFLYPLAADENISYIDTWRCFGRTGGEIPFCPNPKAQEPTDKPLTPEQASSP